MVDDNETLGASQRAEEFLQVFKKGAEFTQSLLKENERLRFRLLEVEASLNSAGRSEVVQLKERLERTEAEKKEILDRVEAIERENLEYANRYAEIETENNLLANLYITTYQLHSTFDLGEVLRIIDEILLNLVGAERFALYLCEAEGRMLQPLNTDSGTPRIAEIEVSEQRVLSVLQDHQPWIASPEEFAQLSDRSAKAVIPLMVDEDLVGVLAIYQLLGQKSCFTQIDEEIFNLLGGHAAMALCTAVLRREAAGKVDFRQGFIERT